MNFGRNFVKFGDFGHVRNFLTNEIQNPGHTRVYLFVFFPNPAVCRKRNFGRNFAEIR